MSDNRVDRGRVGVVGGGDKCGDGGRFLCVQKTFGESLRLEPFSPATPKKSRIVKPHPISTINHRAEDHDQK